MSEPLPPLSEDNSSEELLPLHEDLATEPIETSTDSPMRDVQELTLAEFLGSLSKRPKQSWRAFREILRSDSYGSPERMITVPLEEAAENASSRNLLIVFLANRQNLRLALYGLAFLVVLIGNIILAGSIDGKRSEDVQLAWGLPVVLLGFLIWLSAEWVGNNEALRDWWQESGKEQMLRFFSGLNPARWPSRFLEWFYHGNKKKNDEPSDEFEYKNELPLYMRIPVWRFFLAFIAMLFSTWSWFNSAQNNFAIRLPYQNLTLENSGEWAIAMWIASVLLWGLVFAPLSFNPLQWAKDFQARFRSIRWGDYRLVLLALFGIMLVAWYFRFSQLDTIPREMTDDHVEKILDSGLIDRGYRPVFLANNGGREPVQMYLIALVSHLPNLDINFYTIKWVSACESLLTVPAVFWMGYELMEGESKRRRFLVGLLMAALLAASYWHVAITRQGLRIPLTPLIVAIETVYLTRAIRRNSRADFIKAGIVLGFGLYMYQAVRMLPVVIVAAVALAIIFKAKSLKERLHYLLNLTILVGIAFAAFLPMFHYSVEYPDLFWRRTAGRLLGDDIIQEELADGTLIYRDASLEERLTAFLSHVPTITNNIRNVLLMFNWVGDVGTISGVSMRPSMDIYSAALLIVGLACWMSFAIRRRDTILILMPLFLFIMLMPSALSIAFPGENPSHTRTSGAIPYVYLLAAFPLAFVADILLERFKGAWGELAAGLLCLLLVFGSYNANSSLYFEVFPKRYDEAFHPYSDAGDYLRGFVLTGGDFGNAFLVGAEHWWSHRAIALEAGLSEFWPNGIFPREAIPSFVRAGAERTDRFHLNPDADLIFFYSPNDAETAAYLSLLFPTGISTEFLTHKSDETFMVFRVPALGAEGLATWLAEHPTP
jgi:hypothetical protein